jgi:hypothetical protein
MTQRSSSFWQQHQFWLLVIAAVIIRQIPILSLPFNWLESYFHEISHGIVAILTGGKIIQIQLFTNGAGLCTSQGGSRWLISFFGYAGAILWGCMIYLLAKFHQFVARLFAIVLALLLLVSMLLWVRDLLTLFICLILLGLFVVLLNNKMRRHSQWLTKLLGLIVMMNAIFSPLYLLDGRSLGDGATLANITAIPEFFWVVIWSTMGMVTLFMLGKKS